ncbi:MAG: thioredoxin [Gemmataceae bacterium]|nr:thioredoxin [Gemmataceae bacterium]
MRTFSYTSEYAEREPTRAEIDALPGVTVVEFGAPWCGHCQAAQAGIAAGFGLSPNARHVKIHDSRGQPLGRSFRVKLWPTLVFLHDGVVLAQLVRPDDDQIFAAFASLLGENAD